MSGKASAYRHEAKELRSAAAATGNRVTRETLLKLAEEYERMAQCPVESLPKRLPMKPYIARYGLLDF